MRSGRPNTAAARFKPVQVFEILPCVGLFDLIDQGASLLKTPLVEQLHNPVGQGCNLSGVREATPLKGGYVKLAEEHMVLLTPKERLVK